MATLILPCAGKSTRFKNTRPKWSLTHPYGELMLIQGIKGLELDKYDTTDARGALAMVRNSSQSV